jgi:hypothetical protein
MGMLFIARAWMALKATVTEVATVLAISGNMSR